MIHLKFSLGSGNLSDMINNARWKEIEFYSCIYEYMNKYCVYTYIYIHTNISCVYVYVLSCVQLFVTPWIVACQACLSMIFFQARIPEFVTCVSCIGRQILYHWVTWKAFVYLELTIYDPPSTPAHTHTQKQNWQFE